MILARHRRARITAPLVAILTAAIVLALFVADMVTVGGIIGSRGWISRTEQAKALIDSVRAELLDAETGQRDFFMTGRTEYRDAYEAAARALPATVAELRRLTADDRTQEENVDALASLVGQKLAELRATLDLHRRMEISRALDLVRSDDAATLMGWIRQLIEEMRAREDARHQQRTLAARRHLDAALRIDAAALGGLLILGLILLVINRDIGRRVALEEALREQAAMQERFIAILGHDLRNPLNAVSMAARRLKEADPSERWARSVNYVLSGAGRMTRLVDQLLDLARARQTGGMRLRLRPGTDLGEIVRAAVDELRAAHPRAEIVVTGDGPNDGAWDADRLAQVVSNLVANAIVHGTGRVEVRLARTAGEAVFEVRNGGPPIPADALPRIFEAFQRPPVDGDGIGRAGGLGLGLFIAERIVAAHQGRIAVSSSDQHGTIFAVTLPVSPARAVAQPASDPDPVAARLAIG